MSLLYKTIPLCAATVPHYTGQKPGQGLSTSLIAARVPSEQLRMIVSRQKLTFTVRLIFNSNLDTEFSDGSYYRESGSGRVSWTWDARLRYPVCGELNCQKGFAQASSSLSNLPDPYSVEYTTTTKTAGGTPVSTKSKTTYSFAAVINPTLLLGHRGTTLYAAFSAEFEVAGCYVYFYSSPVGEKRINCASINTPNQGFNVETGSAGTLLGMPISFKACSRFFNATCNGAAGCVASGSTTIDISLLSMELVNL